MKGYEVANLTGVESVKGPGTLRSRSGPTRTRIWRRYASPGSRRPAARSRSAGTGSASGRATTSTAP